MGAVMVSGRPGLWTHYGRLVGVNPFTGPTTRNHIEAPITAGAAFSGTLDVRAPDVAGECRGSYDLNTSKGYHGKGLFSLNFNTMTISALTFNNKNLISATREPQGASSYNVEGHPPFGPFKLSWTAGLPDGNGDFTGKYDVTHDDGYVGSGSFTSNMLDMSVKQVSFNGQDVTSYMSVIPNRLRSRIFF